MDRDSGIKNLLRAVQTSPNEDTHHRLTDEELFSRPYVVALLERIKRERIGACPDDDDEDAPDRSTRRAYWRERRRTERGLVHEVTACQHCHSPIDEGRRIGTRFCGRACYDGHKRAERAARNGRRLRERKCRGCGEPIPPDVNVLREWCSRACKNRYREVLRIAAGGGS